MVQQDEFDAMFDGVEEAPMSGDFPPYEGPGKYISLILRTKYVKARSKKLATVIEKRILKVLSPEGSWPSLHTVGEIVSDYTEKDTDHFLPNLKKMINVIYGVPGDKITKQDCKDIFDPEHQPMSGIVVEMENSQRIAINSRTIGTFFSQTS